jgi:lipopolysaccharide export system protein LptA
LITSEALIQLAGEAGQQGRQIAGNVIDIALAPDGSTPVALAGRDSVQLTFPPEPGTAGRTIRAASLDAKGEPGRGLTRAAFTGNVQYRERGGSIDRTANAQNLDVTLKPGLSSIEQATFTHAVRFEEGKMTALAAAALYDLEKGTLALSGSEPQALVPHVINEQIVVDATTIDLVLDGPKVKAAGHVKSELKPASKGTAPGEAGTKVKMPSMLKQDLPVMVLGNALDYDGTASKGTYTGAARLFQGDTSIKGETIVIDTSVGNLSASGGVTTTTMLDQAGKDKTKQRVHSIGTSKELNYQDADRRLTYTSDAHMVGPEGDMTAERIDLYLKPSGDELERAEGFENVTLREQNRETKGTKMIYTTANETYVVTGAPVKIVDQCQRETTGKTLTFNKGTDRIVVDGGAQIRTQTKGGNGNCTS